MVPAAEENSSKGSSETYEAKHTEWIGNDKSASHRLGHLLGWIQVGKGVSQA